MVKAKDQSLETYIFILKSIKVKRQNWNINLTTIII